MKVATMFMSAQVSRLPAFSHCARCFSSIEARVAPPGPLLLMHNHHGATKHTRR